MSSQPPLRPLLEPATTGTSTHHGGDTSTFAAKVPHPHACPTCCQALLSCITIVLDSRRRRVQRNSSSCIQRVSTRCTLFFFCGSTGSDNGSGSRTTAPPTLAAVPSSLRGPLGGSSGMCDLHARASGGTADTSFSASFDSGIVRHVLLLVPFIVGVNCQWLAGEMALGGGGFFNCQGLAGGMSAGGGFFERQGSARGTAAGGLSLVSAAPKATHNFFDRR